MNVRITPRGAPNRTDLYGSIDRVWSNGFEVGLAQRANMLHTERVIFVPLPYVAEIALDEDGAVT